MRESAWSAVKTGITLIHRASLGPHDDNAIPHAVAFLSAGPSQVVRRGHHAAARESGVPAPRFRGHRNLPTHIRILPHLEKPAEGHSGTAPVSNLPLRTHRPSGPSRCTAHP